MKLINARTGKEYKGLAVPVKKNFPEPIQYTAMFKHGFEYLSGLRLNPPDTAVFFRLLSCLEFENWVRVSQQTIAEDIGITRSQVSLAIKKLIELKIIERVQDPSDRRRMIYRLNPSLGWRGEPKEWVECTVSRKDEPIPPCFIRKK